MTEERFRTDRLADLCARYREACDTYHADRVLAYYMAAERFRYNIDPDDVCALINELGDRR